jgi:hypothetical protein
MAAAHNHTRIALHSFSSVVCSDSEMASVKVFGSPTSAEVARVLMCLFEKEVEFQLIRVDAYRGTKRMPQYLKLQPQGEALTFEDESLTLSGKCIAALLGGCVRGAVVQCSNGADIHRPLNVTLLQTPGGSSATSPTSTRSRATRT